MADYMKKVNMKNIEKLLETESLPTAPVVIQSILKLLNDENSNIRDLSEIISRDPPLASGILKLANSAYYGLSRPVPGIKEAVIVLGFNTVKQLALAVGVSTLFKQKNKIGSFSAYSLWEHSVACSVCAELIARYLGYERPDDVMSMGLLHDIGILLMMEKCRVEYSNVLISAQSEESDLSLIERDQLGFDHGSVGWKLALKWRFPPSLAQVIRFHHKPLLANEENRFKCALIYTADLTCRLIKAGHDGEFVKPSLDAAVMTLLGFDRRTDRLPAASKPEHAHLKIIADLVTEELGKCAEFMNLVRDSYKS